MSIDVTVIGSAQIHLVTQASGLQKSGHAAGLVTLVTGGTAVNACETLRWALGDGPGRDIQAVIPFFKGDIINQKMLRDALEVGTKTKVHPVFVEPLCDHLMAAQVELRNDAGQQELLLESTPIHQMKVNLPSTQKKDVLYLIDGRLSLPILLQTLMQCKRGPGHPFLAVFFPASMEEDWMDKVNRIKMHCDLITVERITDSAEDETLEPVIGSSAECVLAEWVHDVHSQEQCIYLGLKEQGGDDKQLVDGFVLDDPLKTDRLQIAHVAALLMLSTEVNPGFIEAIPLLERLRLFSDKETGLLGIDSVSHVMPQFERIASNAEKDQLTGLRNRHEAERLLSDIEVGCLAVIDIDYFKPLNDHYGHDFGDLCIQLFVRQVESVLRAEDYLFRWGGEEFLLYINASLGEAKLIVNRILKALRDFDFKGWMNEKGYESTPSERSALTASIGLTPILPSQPWIEGLNRADQGVYQAKSNGRDQYVLVMTNT